MGKPYPVVAASAVLLLTLSVSAEAGGSGRTSTTPFTPPGFSHNTTGQTNANWGTNSVSGQPQPPGWSHNSTGQTNANWDATLGGVPPGLAKVPPGLAGK
jgi:hypothetical protein